MLKQSLISGRSQLPEKEKLIRSDVAQVKLLDLLVQRITKLEETLPIRPEGITEPLSPVRVTTTARVIHPPGRKKWFSISIVNDGPDDCWVIVNTEKSSPQPYNCRVGEAYEANFGGPVIDDIRVYTTAGSANLRIRGIR